MCSFLFNNEFGQDKLVPSKHGLHDVVRALLGS